MSRRRATGGAGIVLGAVLLAGCVGGDGVDRRSIAAAMVDGKAGFSPASIRVGEGNRVVLTVNNETDRTHGLSIQGQDVRRDVQPNRPVVVEFVAGDSGTFRVFCHLHDTHESARLVVR